MDKQELLDRCWTVEVEHNDQRPLWDGEVDHVERWPTTEAAACATARAELLAAREEALAAIGDGQDELDASLRTVADALLLVAATKDTDAEQLYPHPDQGLHAFLFWAVNDMPLRTAAHGEGYLRKLAGFPAAVDELRGRLTEAAAAGRAPLRRHAATAVERLDDHLASPLADDPLLQQPAPTEGADPDGWRDAVADRVRDHVRPALADLRATLDEVVRPAGRDDDAAGLCHLDGGEAVYAELVEAYTAQGVTAEQVHETGLAQVERLAEEYRVLGQRALGTSDLEEVLGRLRDDASLRHQDRDEVVARARAMHARAEAAAPAFFRRTPTSPCEVRSTEVGSLAFYSPPSPDGTRPGTFYFNTSEAGVWGPHLAATVFHEGVPGHHFQSALAIEDTDLHELHRSLFLPAFGEGWGLYSERLAEEMGLYEDDLQRLGMLMADSLRACRLVVDSGMHAFGWSRDRAIDYLGANAPLHHSEVVAEIDRYIGLPGQATSYMMGRLTLERLRAETATRLGDAFDLAAFHDVVLSRGMLSLPALELVVRRWDGS